MKESQTGKTKIVCTLGPATHSVGMLLRLLDAGMDVVRLNFSHGTYAVHRETINNVREAARQAGRELAILQDLQGPKIRIGDFTTPSVELRPGMAFTITADPVEGTVDRVSTSYHDLPKDVKPGDRILLDDGKLRLQVREVKGNDVHCSVVIGGKLSARKGINLPGTAVSAPSLTEKDKEDLVFGLQNDIDYVALSFVRSPDDIRTLRDVMTAHSSPDRFVPVIAKIEKPQAIANLDAIIAEADGIMIARGDLGVELPPEDVPILQKKIVAKCNDAGKPVIIATQMLESMIDSPTPTRAEASDVANAVVDGGDAVMLSGETSVGKYPLEAVQIMNRIICKVEGETAGSRHVMDLVSGAVENRLDALGRAACLLAEQMNAAAIVVVTHSGATAHAIARHRPRPKIVAFTDSPRIRRRLGLVWGVNGMVIGDLSQDSDRELARIQEKLVASGIVSPGEYIVLLAGQPFFARGSTNFIKVEQVD